MSQTAASATGVGYSRIQKTLHWTTLALVAAQYLVFGGISEAFEQSMKLGVPQYLAGTGGHIVTGALILVLTLWRLTLRVREGAPPPPAEEPGILQLIATGTHYLFYALLLFLPFSGSVAWFLQVGPAAGGHMVMKTLLMGLIALHVLAVLAHQLWWKTGIMKRMV